MIYKLILVLLLIILIFYVLNRLIKVQENMSMRNNYLNYLLNKNGYKIDFENYSILDKNNNLLKKYSTLNFNTNESHKTAKNKPLTNNILNKNNIPTPNHIIITKDNLFMFKDTSQYFPCVLKPVDGMQGKDVYTHIDTQEEFDHIINKLIIKYDKIMLENLVEGNNYRIFIFNDKVMDIIEREKPYIIGDGISNVDELIKRKNDDLVKRDLFTVKYIDKKLIKSYGYNMNDIVKKNNKIFITNTVNFHNGANAKRIDINKVNKKNIEIFIKAHKLIGLECSGVDYMSNDISVAYYKNKGQIIEVNDLVDTKIHIDADNQNNSYFLFENIVKSLRK